MPRVVKFYFPRGKIETSDTNTRAIREIVAAVKAGATATISGYVDSTGRAERNVQIAQERAEAVLELLKEAGAPERKLEIRQPDDIVAGRGAEARRVEVTLS